MGLGHSYPQMIKNNACLIKHSLNNFTNRTVHLKYIEAITGEKLVNLKTAHKNIFKHADKFYQKSHGFLEHIIAGIKNNLLNDKGKKNF